MPGTATCTRRSSPPPGDEAARARIQSAFEDTLDDAIALGGTVTGEHGVGLLKMLGMNKELGPAVLSMHHAVKAALDPHGILNPGKVLGIRARCSTGPVRHRPTKAALRGRSRDLGCGRRCPDGPRPSQCQWDDAH